MNSHTALTILVCASLVGCSAGQPASSAAPVVPEPSPAVAPGSDAPVVAPAAETPPSEAFVPPGTHPGEDGWELYDGALTLTPQTAHDLRPGNGTPEAAVMHFYASRMRGDKDYEQALPPERSARLDRKLQHIERWTFLEVQLVKKKQGDDGVLWIKIRVQVEIDGKRDGGTDDVELRSIEGKWYVVGIPT